MGIMKRRQGTTNFVLFTDLETANDYYNVEGGVGSRIAQQLQKGDKIRIGINGNIQSQDLKVKKWSKEDSYV
jgi:hypothetical protein